MFVKFLDEEIFYNTFLTEIIEVQCGDHYDENNPQHVNYLKNFINAQYLCGGVAICLFLDDNKPVGFIYVIHDKGLENVGCFGKKASIAMLAVKEEYRNNGYGKHLCQVAEKYALDRGAECIYVDTPDDKEDRRALRFYLNYGFTPIACLLGINGINDVGQVYFYKVL